MKHIIDLQTWYILPVFEKLCIITIIAYFHIPFQTDILSADRQLAKEIEFDLRKFEEEQEEMRRQEDQQNTVQGPQVIIQS